MGQVTQNDINEIKTLLDTDAGIIEAPKEQAIETSQDDDIVEDSVVIDADELASNPLEDTDDDEQHIEPDPTGDDYQFPNDIASLAEAIDVSLDDLYGLEVKMPDGQDSIKLGDLKNKVIENARDTQRLEATIEEQKTQLEQASAGNNVQTQASQQKVALMGKLQSIQAEYQSTDWSALEARDAGEAALLRQKFNDAANATQGQMTQLDAYEKQQKQQYLHKSATKIMEMIPEWTDQDVRTSATQAIETLLVGEGMSQRQVGGVTDPIAVKLLNELVHLRAQVKSAEKTVEQVRKAPKVLRNKARVNKSNTNKRDALVKKAQQTHNRHDETAAGKAILGW